MEWRQSWQLYALGLAFFAGLTTIFEKIGIAQVNSDLATFLRTVVILFVLAAVVTLKPQWQRPDDLPVKSVVFFSVAALLY